MTTVRTDQATTAPHSDDAADDPYPSRKGRPPEFLERREPTVHGSTPGPLTADQAAAFDRDGYLVVPDVLSATEVHAVDEALSDFVRTLTEADRHRLIVEPGGDPDDPSSIRSVFAFHADGGPLADVVRDERLTAVARQLLGSDVYVHQSRVNRKPPFRGKDFQWHSDFETWHTEDGMPGMRCLSAVVWLTDNHAWNGPLMVMPGSHQWFVTCPTPTPRDNHERSLQVQEVGVPDEASLTALYETCGIEQATGPAGSVLFFDCNLLHASASNLSPIARRNLFVVYNSVENAVVEPYSAPGRRPEHIAARTFEPV